MWTRTHVRLVCESSYERPGVADCSHHGGTVCSLCRSADGTCHDRCKSASAPTDVRVKITRPGQRVPALG